jgi:hypothetical protein
MEKQLLKDRTEIIMKVIGKMIKFMDLELLFVKMVINILENGMMIKCMDKGKVNKQMGIFMKDNGKMI